ncbi:MAG TPA: hypothetical protein VFR22_17245 [Nocardioidaceae bacterium]|nr:hypothetical protein [Nocardioidaceae bacterium]
MPWRAPLAGAASSGVVVLLVDAVGDEPYLLFVMTPVLVCLWSAVTVIALRGLRSDRKLAITALGFVVGAYWALGIPYEPPSAEWNIAVLIAGTVGPMLAELLVRSPSVLKLAVAAVVFVFGLALVDQVSDHAGKQAYEAALVQSPTAYAADVSGWTLVDGYPSPTDHTTRVTMQAAADGGGDVQLTTYGRQADAAATCRSGGDECSRQGALWISRTGPTTYLYRSIDGQVVRMEADRRTVTVDAAVQAMLSLRTVSVDELEQFAYYN